MREVLDAMLYVAASGGVCRLLPKCFPPVSTAAAPPPIELMCGTHAFCGLQRIVQLDQSYNRILSNQLGDEVQLRCNAYPQPTFRQ